MTDTLKLENIEIENLYKFSINYKGKKYKNLSLGVNNYKGRPKIEWISYNYNLEKLENFVEIEKKIFNYIKTIVKKQYKNNIISLTIKENGQLRFTNNGFL